MGQLSDIVSAMRRKGLTLPSGQAPLFRHRYVTGERDYERDVGDGTNSSLITVAMGWYARTFPEAPIGLWQKVPDGDDKRINSHPFLSLLARPNQSYSGRLMWMGGMISFLGDGNLYLLKDRSAGGRVVRLWYVPHWMVEPKAPADGSEFISHYEYRPGGQAGAVRLAVEDVVHLRYGLDPANTRKGLSPVKALLREVYTDEEAARFTAAMLRNMGVAGIVVSPKDNAIQFAPDEALAMKTKIQQNTTGDRRGEAIVTDIPIDVMPIADGMTGIDMARVRAIPESRVAAAFGIPASVLGYLSGMQQTAVGATLREQRELAYESAIVPVQDVLADELQVQLLDDFVDDVDGYRVGFDRSGVRVLQEDEDARWDRVVRGVQGGVILVSEARQELGFTPGPDDEVYLRPLSVVEVGPGADPVTIPAARQGAANDAAPKGRLRTKVARESAADRRMFRMIERHAQRIEREWARDLVAAFEDLGERAYRAVREDGLDGMKAMPSDSDDIDRAARILRAVGTPQFTDEMIAPTFLHYYTLTLEAVAEAVSARLGVEVGVNLADPIMRQVIAEGGKRVGLLDIERDTRDALFNALYDARAAGEGFDVAARRIRTYVTEGRYRNAGVQYRAQMIAHTESRYAQNVSALASYQQSQVVGALLVFDAQLGPTDAECEERNGRVISFEEAQEIAATEHPNGTLSFGPWITQ